VNAKLATSISEVVTKPSEKDEFFGNDVDAVRRLEDERENIRNALNSCDTNLFMGVFFDGTGNNFENSLNRQDYSYSMWRGSIAPIPA